jgi:PEP-CTERM motif
VSETIHPAQNSYPLGLGASFQVAASASPEILDIYVTGFDSRMKLTATLSGGGSESLTASNTALIPNFDGAGNYASFGFFSVEYSGTGETLALNLTADNQTGIPTNAPQYDFRNAGVFAATVSAGSVPEPSSLLLSTIGLAGMLGWTLIGRRQAHNAQA